MRRWLLLLALPLVAAENRVRIHPPAPGGISSLYFGRDGMLYLGGDRMYRYDGFRYSPMPGYPFREADLLALTADGQLWVASPAEGLAICEGLTGCRVIHTGGFEDAAATPEFALIRANKRLTLIDRQGKSRSLPLTGPCELSGSDGIARISCPDGAYRLNAAGEAIPASKKSLALHDRTGRFWTLEAGKSIGWEAGKQVAVVEGADGRAGLGLAAGAGGQVWFLDGAGVRGLAPPTHFPYRTRERIVVTEDPNGHVWVGTTSGQLAELIPDANWRQWPATEFGSTPVQPFRDATGTLTLLTETGLFRYDETGKRWRGVGKGQGKYAYALPLPGGGILAAIRDYGLAEVAPDGGLKRRVKGSEAVNLQDDFRALALGPNGRIFAGNKKALFEVTGGELKLVELPGVKNLDESDRRPFANAVDFATDPHGHLWVGYAEGVARLDDDGIWRRLETGAPVRDTRAFGFRGPGDVWIAHRAKGYFSRVVGGQATEFRSDSGYPPAETAFLKGDRRGWVWRGTANGVYVSNGRDLAAGDWLYLNAGESQQYGFFEDGDGSVWLASADRVVHVRPSAEWFTGRPGLPVISRVAVGDRITDVMPEQIDLAKPLTVEFCRIGVPGFHSGEIRYRVPPLFEDWRVAAGGRLQVRDLKNGEYALEVRQPGAAEVLRHAFRVGPAPLWRPWWYSMPVVAALVWIHRRREWIGYQLRKRWFLLGRRRNREANRQWEDTGAGTLWNGRYRMRRPMARGGFARVYEALDEDADRLVAIKVFYHRSGDAGWVRSRYAQEVTALKLIRHEGVVPLLDSWIEPSGEPCLAMPLIEGETLRAALSRGALPREEGAQLLREVALTLEAVHTAGVVHRDLKPENILIRADGFPLLIDFGASGLLGPLEEPGMTRLLAGSVEYLAPERLTGQYSSASDVYSLGAIAFEVFSGKMLADSKVRMLDGDLESALRGYVGEGLAAPVAAALDPLPERRPCHLSDWAEEIVRAAGVTGP